MSGEDDRGARERRDKMAAIARSLAKAFEGHGFALLVFDKTPRDGRVSYVSNCDRGDMIKAMRRLIAEYGAAPTLAAADRETLADLARRAAARPVDPRLFGHPVAEPEALRALEALRVSVAGLVVAFLPARARRPGRGGDHGRGRRPGPSAALDPLRSMDWTRGG